MKRNKPLEPELLVGVSSKQMIDKFMELSQANPFMIPVEIANETIAYFKLRRG